MIWLMIWIVCASGSCWESRVEQEFRSQDECQYALDYYRQNEGVNGICTVYKESDGT